jgi:hypothetical protein
MDQPLTVDDIIRDHNARKALRSQAEPMWDEIITNMIPRRASIYKMAPNTPNTAKIYDGLPAKAINLGAAVLQSMLTNRQLEWFRLEVDNPELNDMREVKEWLTTWRDTIRKALDNSNFYSQAHEFYVDILSLCTAVMYCEPYARAGRDLYFSTRHLREVYLLEGDQGRQDRINLVREMSALQIMDRWRWARKTGNIPDVIVKAYEKGDCNQTFEILQAVYPNPDGKEDAVKPELMPYYCKWIELQSKQEITTDGYNEFPFVTCFWSKFSGDVYGRGPGWSALPSVKMLYAMRQTALRVAEKIADPPLQVPRQGFLANLKLTPGGINFYEASASGGRIEPLVIGANFNINLEMIQDERNQVLEHFYANQLQIVDAKQMTAEEVRARIAENARILGPTFDRLNDDYLDPLIYRVIGILRRSGRLQEPPDVVLKAAEKLGVQLRVRFVSPLAKAQVASEVQGITHTMATAIEWATGTQDVGVFDNLDLDVGISKIAELDGAPLEFIRDAKKRDAIRAQRAAQAEAARRAALAKETAGAMDAAASADAQNAETAQMVEGTA